MLGTILGLINPLNAIGDKIIQYRIAAANAENTSERITADQNIAQLEARQAVLIAEQSGRLTRWIRPLFALPFIIYNFKVIVIDKVFGWGTTDPLSDNLIQLQMIVFGAYFLTRGAEKLFRR